MLHKLLPTSTSRGTKLDYYEELCLDKMGPNHNEIPLVGNDRENARMHSAVTKIRNDRDARNKFFDAAETVTQMIELGYIRLNRDRPWFYPNVDEKHDEWISQYARESYLREIFFANREMRQRAQSALEQRVQ